MIDLNKKDIEDIANGDHNRHVQNCDQQELLQTLAQKLLDFREERNDNLDDVQTQVENLKDAVNKYKASLNYDDKIEEIANTLEELKHV